MTRLPAFFSIRGLAVELCPEGRQLNEFKRELRRILDHAGIPFVLMRGYKKKRRYMLADIERLAPWVIEAIIVQRKNRGAMAA